MIPKINPANLSKGQKFIVPNTAMIHTTIEVTAHPAGTLVQGFTQLKDHRETFRKVFQRDDQIIPVTGI